MMHWKFWNRFRTHINMVKRDRSRLRLSDWQSDSALTGLAAKVLANPDVRLMLDVVTNEHPGFNVISDDANPNVRVAYQCRGEGYTQALANLEALARFRKPFEPLEATFEPPEEEQQ